MQPHFIITVCFFFKYFYFKIGNDFTKTHGTRESGRKGEEPNRKH